VNGFGSREVLQRARERRECEDSARRLFAMPCCGVTANPSKRFEGDSTCAGAMDSPYGERGLIFTAFATHAHADEYGLDRSHGH
jgi:hypothetical protein